MILLLVLGAVVLTAALTINLFRRRRRRQMRRTSVNQATNEACKQIDQVFRDAARRMDAVVYGPDDHRTQLNNMLRRSSWKDML